MESILLATDLSPWCDRAKERALWLARRDGRPLTVLHVVGDESPATREQAREVIAEMLDDEARDLETDMVITAGEPWEEIGIEIRRRRPGLVLMGRHRREALRDFFISPTAAMVESGPPILQAVNLPVGPWRRVVVATDFSPLAQRALAVALDLAPEAQIHLMHAFEMPFAGFITNQVDTEAVIQRNREDLSRAAREAAQAAGVGGRHLDLVLTRGAVVPTLHAEVKRLTADLLAIGTAGGGGGQTLGSTARALSLDPPCDLLVVPPGE